MALIKELLNVLDDKEEPLAKRLKIANNAFNSNELPIQHREVVLLKWISKWMSESDDNAALMQCYDWLSSEQIKDLSRSDISREDIHHILDVIVSRLNKSKTNHDILINITIALIENRVLQEHFKHDLNNYLDFISQVIANIEDPQLMLTFLKNEQLFNKHYISVENFHETFIDKTLILLCDTALKCSDDERIFGEISKILQKCLFHKNFKSFENYFNFCFNSAQADDNKLPELLLQKFQSIYALVDVNSSYVYKLLLHAFCATYKSDFAIIYKFTILLISSLGFDLHDFKLPQKNNASLRKSLHILAGIFEVLRKNKNTFDCKVNDVSFTCFLQTLIKSIINLTKKPTVNTLKILSLTIEINPLVIEPIISQIIVYIMLSHNSDITREYEALLTNVFDVFSKLHRIHSLIVKMATALKDALKVGGNQCEEEIDSNLYKFPGELLPDSEEIASEYAIDEILPKSAMDCFSQCVTSLASWQVMNLYKTLLFHLNAALDDPNVLNITENTNIYMEIVCTLMCEFLSSVRIAEHTVPILVVNKFVKCMDEQKAVLAKFGTALVAIEHKHSLVRAYLNVCYTWAELYINLSYYSLNNEVTIKTQMLGCTEDDSAYNITYLHSYLSSDQWLLISERITNFGEKPCKQIMQKLCIQKLRAMLIFERNFNEDILSSIVNNILASIEDYYDLLINDNFCLSVILSKMDAGSSNHLSDLVINDLIKHKTCLKPMKDSNILSKALIYTTLANINKLMQFKRKNCISAQIFALLNELECDFDTLTSITHIFNTAEGDAKANDQGAAEINEDSLMQHLNILKQLPVMFLNANILSVVYMFFAALLRDLKTSEQRIRHQLAQILLGIIQIGTISIPNLYKSSNLITFIINNVEGYKETFDCVLENTIKHEGGVEKLKKVVNYLVKDLNNEKNLDCVIIMLHFILKHKKSKINPANKLLLEDYKEKICEGIIKLTMDKSDNDNIEAYAMVLKIYLTASDKPNVDLLKKQVQSYVTKALECDCDATGSLILFSAILQHKATFEDIVKDNFILNIWNATSKMRIEKEKHDQQQLYAKLKISIFEHIPNDQFPEITNNLLTNTVAALKNNDLCQFECQFKTWCAILSCSFNAHKTVIWQQAIQSLLLSIEENCNHANINVIADDLVAFYITLIQTTQLLLTPTIIDLIFYTISYIIVEINDFNAAFNSCIHMMEALLKHRKASICDRLPSILQQYRKLLNALCINSDSLKQLSADKVAQIQNGAHQFEKLTKHLTSYNKHMASVAIYVISDILKQYETITLYPGVKLHLNNCLYSLISLCDQHAIACLMRVLSTASTEIFKLSYETYKRYYRFTGKV